MSLLRSCPSAYTTRWQRPRGATALGPNGTAHATLTVQSPTRAMTSTVPPRASTYPRIASTSVILPCSICETRAWGDAHHGSDLSLGERGVLPQLRELIAALLGTHLRTASLPLCDAIGSIPARFQFPDLPLGVLPADCLHHCPFSPHLLSITITYFVRISQRIRHRNRGERSPGAPTAPVVTLGHGAIAARATDILVWRALHQLAVLPPT